MIREMQECKHCGNGYVFAALCDRCEKAGHTDTRHGKCVKCERFLMAGKIEFGRHFCNHCGKRFRMRSEECWLCLECLARGCVGRNEMKCGRCLKDPMSRASWAGIIEVAEVA